MGIAFPQQATYSYSDTGADNERAKEKYSHSSDTQVLRTP